MSDSPPACQSVVQRQCRKFCSCNATNVSSRALFLSVFCGLQRFLQEHGEVQLSALGVAISSMVTLAEILKNKQLALETRIVTSLEEINSDSRCAPAMVSGRMSHLAYYCFCLTGGTSVLLSAFLRPRGPSGL